MAASDIPKLAAFAPEEWHLALDAVLIEHFGRAYFHARVVAEAEQIVAVGHGIATGHAGWIGNIIVRPEARNRGLGSQITRDVMDHLRTRGCATLLLIATKLGESVYSRLGFRKTGEYVFLRVPRLEAAPTQSVRRLHPCEAGDVFKLDALATGEAREGLLAPHLDSGWGHVSLSGALDGFFLPSFGSGFVMASEPAAGLELLGFKHAFYPGNAVVPDGNAAAIQFLKRHGAEETARAPRMAIGDEVAWRPEFIFGRAAGYCG